MDKSIFSKLFGLCRLTRIVFARPLTPKNGIKIVKRSNLIVYNNRIEINVTYQYHHLVPPTSASVTAIACSYSCPLATRDCHDIYQYLSATISTGPCPRPCITWGRHRSPVRPDLLLTSRLVAGRTCRWSQRIVCAVFGIDDCRGRP